MPRTPRATDHAISRRSALALGVAAGAVGLGQATASAAARSERRAAALNSRVHLFYYPWYGNPQFNGDWRHWNQTGVLTPPDQIASNYYPKLGPYDSGDTAGTVDQHMRWIVQSGAGTIVTSWWGRGSYEDKQVPGLLATAAKYGIKVAWHIEPYSGRSAASVASDVQYINDTYGSSPAFYRDGAHGNRPAFYIFDSLNVSDWSALDAVNSSNIILAQHTDESKTAHFGGLYNYAVNENPSGWGGFSEWLAQRGLVWAPSVGPGFINQRAVPGSTSATIERANGAVYDRNWDQALNSSPTTPPAWVSVTSFNEWHEGTMIEPAVATPPTALDYMTYSGAWDKTGTAAETSYLERTAYWVGQFA